jgi:hypothetical protein
MNDAARGNAKSSGEAVRTLLHGHGSADWLRVAGSSSPAAAAGPRTIDRMSSSVDVGIASDNVANFNGSGPGSSAATNSTEDTATVVRAPSGVISNLLVVLAAAPHAVLPLRGNSPLRAALTLHMLHDHRGSTCPLH